MKRRICSLVLAAVIAFSAAGCNQKGDTLNDGYYTARMSDYSHGWMEFVTICVSDGHLVSIEYNAKGPSGYLKSWDIPYMRTMGGLNGTYPNEYTRNYGAQFLEAGGDVSQVQAIAGATSSYKNFVRLADAAVGQSRAGDSSVAVVEAQS
ncbi:MULTISPECIES: hypothetical protein [unclassified Anaerotruncus]|jgi:major membrane immunogen (membrane-anchored lipoprotein)|uniref:hypothetical protein n=1 Tax=unclassified Anaerotruncus TaxID=2641626 RepID=UPI00033ACB99|nr:MULTISPECIES: hypothetical protein [unclassified Anaerotruncus]EOS55204.1 hypothetical protein C814_03242 [Anaerotruncus sp. G3(2012)]MCI9236256.1 FMN-binding protein [Anaerotruncus sp.]NBK20148.1 FMN-binding protein [Anaerotruncus sp. 1XD42-93]RKJ77354.1 FMN-binding protein [Anaerotruncus sp. 1XD22-93]